MRPKCVCMCVCVCVCLSVCPRARARVCVCVCMFVIIIKLGTVTTSEMRMRHVLMILILTFIQGHTCRHDFRNCSSHAHQVCCEDSPTQGLSIYSLLSPMSLIDKCFTSNIIAIHRAICKLWLSKFGMTVDVCMAYMLMLGSMTLTLMWVCRGPTVTVELRRQLSKH